MHVISFVDTASLKEPWINQYLYVCICGCWKEIKSWISLRPVFGNDLLWSYSHVIF